MLGLLLLRSPFVNWVVSARVTRGTGSSRVASTGAECHAMWPLSVDSPKLRGIQSLIQHIEQDRSKHAICRLSTALRLLAGVDVRVPSRAFPAFNPTRWHRALQMAISAVNLSYAIAWRERTIVSGSRLAYLAGELQYFGDHVTSRGIRCLASKRPFFVVPGAPEASLAREIGCDLAPKSRIHFSSQCVVIVQANYQGIPAVFRVGGCDESRSEVLRQFAGLNLAQSSVCFQKLAPRLLLQTRTPCGFELSIETAVPGMNAPFSWKRIDGILELCLTAGATNVLARTQLTDDVAQVCESFPDQRDPLLAIAGHLLEWHADSRFSGYLVHGDLWLGNVLFSGDHIAGVVDWEWARRDGFGFVDALHLLLMSYSVSRNVRIAETLRALWTNTLQDLELNLRLLTLSRHFGFGDHDLKFAALVLWFNYLHERVVRGRMPSAAWSEDMLPRSIPVIQAWLSAYEKRGTSEATSGPRTERLSIPGL